MFFGRERDSIFCLLRIPSTAEDVVKFSLLLVFITTKMADDAARNFCPPSKKAKYNDDAANAVDLPGAQEAVSVADDVGIRSTPSEPTPESNGILSIADDEEGERQIMNGEAKVSFEKAASKKGNESAA